LHLDVFGRVSLGAPVEGLQPGADHHSTAFGYEFEAVHGFADEVLGGVAGVGDVIHAEEVGGVDHRAQHVAVVGHADDVLSGVGEVDLAVPRHDARDVEGEAGAGVAGGGGG